MQACAEAICGGKGTARALQFCPVQSRSGAESMGQSLSRVERADLSHTIYMYIYIYIYIYIKSGSKTLYIYIYIYIYKEDLNHTIYVYV